METLLSRRYRNVDIVI